MDESMDDVQTTDKVVTFDEKFHSSAPVGSVAQGIELADGNCGPAAIVSALVEAATTSGRARALLQDLRIPTDQSMTVADAADLVRANVLDALNRECRNGDGRQRIASAMLNRIPSLDKNDSWATDELRQMRRGFSADMQDQDGWWTRARHLCLGLVHEYVKTMGKPGTWFNEFEFQLFSREHQLGILIDGQGAPFYACSSFTENALMIYNAGGLHWTGSKPHYQYSSASSKEDADLAEALRDSLLTGFQEVAPRAAERQDGPARVWDHFSTEGCQPRKARCRSCSKFIKFGRNGDPKDTTNLKHHLVNYCKRPEGPLKKEFECPNCQPTRTFAEQRNLTAHLKNDICKSKPKEEDEVRQWISQYNELKKKYDGHIPPKDTDDRKEYYQLYPKLKRRRMLPETSSEHEEGPSKPQIECPDCSASFTRNNGLKKHVDNGRCPGPLKKSAPVKSAVEASKLKLQELRMELGLPEGKWPPKNTGAHKQVLNLHNTLKYHERRSEARDLKFAL